MINLEEAERVLQAAKAKAIQLGVPMSIAVVDPRGDPVGALRMDMAKFLTFDVARGKAFAAAFWGIPSGDMTAVADNPVIRSVVMMEGGRIIPGQGAVPLLRGAYVIGAVGASGGTGQQDEEVAKAGANAL
jgi:uncharacterized protein GlcG (DUF336 family)